jgi:uncharacterized damage-inducible protein DinB
MPPIPLSGAKAASLDFRRSFLEIFAINEKSTQLLLNHIADAAWQAPSPSGRGRSIADIASHMHSARLMWLSAADKTAKLPAELWERGSLWRACAFGK